MTRTFTALNTSREIADALRTDHTCVVRRAGHEYVVMGTDDMHMYAWLAPVRENDPVASPHFGQPEDTELEDASDYTDVADRLLDWLRTPKTLNDFAAEVHYSNQKWWVSLEDGHTRLQRNKGELLMLIVSEIAEAMEGERKDLMDDKLPHRKMAEVELADALIRIFDYCGAHGYDLMGAYTEKMAYNQTREDHKHEARAIAGGKKW